MHRPTVNVHQVRLASEGRRGQATSEAIDCPTLVRQNHGEGTMLDTTPNARIKVFLDKFDAALAAGDVDAVARLFAKESYWRDLVAFTWNIKTMEGRDQVRDMLAHGLKRTKPRDWRIAEGETATEA